MRRPSVTSGSTDPAAADLAVQVQQRPAAWAGRQWPAGGSGGRWRHTGAGRWRARAAMVTCASYRWRPVRWRRRARGPAPRPPGGTRRPAMTGIGSLANVDHVLTTERLVLRPVAAHDHAVLLAHWTLPDVRRFLFDGEALSAAEVTETIEDSIQDFSKDGYGIWIIQDGTGPVGT